MMDDGTVLCENPKPGKQPTRMPRWKYDVVRSAILEVLSSTPQGMAYKSIVAAVASALDTDTRDRLGSLSWHTVVVKLDLEARGLIERVPGTRPQLLRTTGRES
jgi:hypothetical protein